MTRLRWSWSRFASRTKFLAASAPVFRHSRRRIHQFLEVLIWRQYCYEGGRISYWQCRCTKNIVRVSEYAIFNFASLYYFWACSFSVSCPANWSRGYQSRRGRSLMKCYSLACSFSLHWLRITYLQSTENCKRQIQKSSKSLSLCTKDAFISNVFPIVQSTICYQCYSGILSIKWSPFRSGFLTWKFMIRCEAYIYIFKYKFHFPHIFTWTTSTIEWYRLCVL